MIESGGHQLFYWYTFDMEDKKHMQWCHLESMRLFLMMTPCFSFRYRGDLSASV